MTVSSAGVYNSAGLLVRTLWSAQTDDIRATNPAATWNGLMDDGTAAPAGTYTIKLLQNNCTYNWDGSLGNTSPDHTSSVLYHAWEECIADMAITAGGEIYFTSVDNERRVVAQVATTANPQTCRPVVPQAFRATYGNTTFVCADATRVYWGMFDGGVPDSFGWAVGQANGAFNNLTQKSPYQPPSGHTGRGFGVVTNLYAYNTTPGKSFEGTPGGIAVQQTGNYLYLSRPYQNKITTSNKTSGADLQINTTIMQPNRMAINPADDSLWVIHAVYTATHGVQFNGTSQDVRFAAINYGVAGAARSWSAWFKTTATSGCIFAQTTSTTDPATATTWAATMYIGSDGKLYGGMWTGAANTINSVAVVNDGNWHLGAFTVSATGVCNLYVDQGQPVTATFSAPSEAWWTDTWIANGKGDGFTNAGTGDRWFNGSLADCRVYSSVISVLEVSNLYLGQNANSAAKAEYTFQTVSATDASGNGFNGVIAGSPTGVTGPIQIGPLFVAPTATVEKYTADGSGNLSSTGVTIATALNNPICLDVDPTGATLLVVDGALGVNFAYHGTGTSQIYAFNTSDGSVKSAFGTSGKFGTAGGYLNSPAVTNTKWCFTSVNPHAAQSFLRFAPDGSWWLGDQGNYRCLHFSSGNSPTYIEQIMTIPLFYSQRIVRNGNDFTRVLVNLLEFSVDYTKSLSPTNGSWTLTYNWSGNLSSTQVEVTQGIFTLLNFATVCSNGRTYGLGRSSSAGNRIWEMNPTTGIRDTSIILLNNAYLDKNFNQWLYWPNNAAGSFPVGTPQQQAGQQSFLYENPFTGFDGSNNPTWQFTTGVPDAQYQHAGQLVYTSQVYPSNFSYNNQGGDAGLEECKIERTAGGLIIFFSTTMTNPYVYTDAKGHLFGWDPISGNIKWAAYYGQPTNYGGAYITGGAGSNLAFLFYPADAKFAFGSGSNGGGFHRYIEGDTNIFSTYCGEDWGNNQVNKLYHWHESGLLVNSFGPGGAPYTGPDSGRFGLPLSTDPNGLPPCGSPYSWLGLQGMTGNTNWGSLALVSGVYYIYQNDEWYQGGASRWSISNTNSISLSNQTLHFNGTPHPPIPDPTNLLADLPYNSTIPSGGNWTRAGQLTDILGTSQPIYALFTNGASVDRYHPDFCFYAAGTGLTGSITRALPAVTGNWTLSGTIYAGVGGIPDNLTPPLVASEAFFMDLVDGGGKIIVRMYFAGNSTKKCWVVNDIAQLALLNFDWDNEFRSQYQSFSIASNISGNQINLAYGSNTASITGVYQVGANMAAPTKFMITYVSPGGSLGLDLLGFRTLQFPTASTPSPFYNIIETYYFLEDHYINNVYYPAGTTAQFQAGSWIPTPNVDPLDANALNTFYNVGPQVAGLVRTQFDTLPVHTAATYWKLIGPDLWQLTGLGAGLAPVSKHGVPGTLP